LHLLFYSRIWAFGPKKSGPNILFNHIPGYCTSEFWKARVSTENPVLIEALDIEDPDADPDQPADIKPDSIPEHESLLAELSETERWNYRWLQQLDFSLTNGFQLATAAGPLCEEPLTGVAFFVEQCEIAQVEESSKYLPVWISGVRFSIF
jgi:ribosome assembly protein 1